LQGSPLVPNLGHPEISRAYYRKAMPLALESAADPQDSQAAADYATLLMRAAVLPAPPEGLATLRKAAEVFVRLEAAGGRDVYSTLEVTARLYMGHRLAAMGQLPAA